MVTLYCTKNTLKYSDFRNIFGILIFLSILLRCKFVRKVYKNSSETIN